MAYDENKTSNAIFVMQYLENWLLKENSKMFNRD